MKELKLLSSKLSFTQAEVLCDLRYLAFLKVQRFAFTNAVFSHASRLDKLTTLELHDCPHMTKNVCSHLTGLVSLTELRLTGNLGVSQNIAIKSVLASLERLQKITVL